MAQSVLAKMAVQITANNAEFSNAMRTMQSQLKTTQNSLKTFGNALGFAFGGAALVAGARSAIGVLSEFEASMSEVKAITGATGKDFDALRKDALDLGAATKFTAKEVSQLQVAYGRLGFSTKEILNATKATLDLAAATGEDLSKSADIAGSTIRAFGLDADQTQRVADVMASSFNKSALGLENFGEAMKYVAPVAANANISLEQTTAILGVLADAGIRGSQAGTSLRKIISDLGQGAGPILAKRLKELASAGLSGADAMSEVGRTAYASLLVLSKNTEKIDEMTKAYQSASGEVAKMAAIMQDNLQGDVTKLTSAFQGLILEGSSLIGLFRSIVQSITGIINAISNLNSELDLIGQAVSPFRDLKDVADSSKAYLLKNGRTDSGKDVADVLKPITGQSNDEFFKNVNQNLRDFITLLTKEGESVSDATTLWQYYLKTRIDAKNADTAGAADQRFKEVIDEKAAAVMRFASAIKESNTELRKFSTTDFSVLDDFNKLGEALKKIAEIRKYGDIKLPDFSEFSKGFKMPDVEPLKNFFNEFKEINVELAPIVTEFAQTLGEFFADLNSGVGQLLPFGERLKALVGGIMQAVGGALIAIGLGKIAIKLPGPQAIAAGIALVAAGAALSRSSANARKAINGGSGGSSSSSNVDRAADTQQEIRLVINDGKPVEFIASGATLSAVMSKYDYKKGRGAG